MKNLSKIKESIKEMLRRMSGGNVAGTAIESDANEWRYKVTPFYRGMLASINK